MIHLLQVIFVLMRWSSCNRGEEKHGRATEPLSLSEPADPPYTRTHSPNSVRNVKITLTQTNTGISAQTSHSSADRSLRRPSLFYSCSEPSRLAPFTLLSAKRRRKVISLLSSCHFGTFLFCQTWAVTLGPGHMRTPLYNSLRRKQHKTANSFYTSASCPW